jgi:hypothetical protein
MLIGWVTQAAAALRERHERSAQSADTAGERFSSVATVAPTRGPAASKQQQQRSQFQALIRFGPASRSANSHLGLLMQVAR